MLSIDSLQPVFDKIKAAPPGAILLLDIDETLLYAADGVGSEPWYDALIQSSIAKGMGNNEAVIAANAAWEAVQSEIPVHLTEPLVLEILKYCLDNGVRTMGLTARRPETESVTRHQLGSLGIDLKLTAWFAHDFEITEEARHLGGILFGGPLVRKGTLWGKLLDMQTDLPRYVVFADDKYYHAQSVGEMCRQRGIPSDCFCYLRPH